MAKAIKKSFVFNCEWAEVLADYPAEVRLEVYDAVIRYAASGTLTELRPLAKMAFSFIKKEIDYNNQRYDEIVEKHSAAGRKGMKSRYSDENKKDSDNLTKLTNDNKTNKSNKCYQAITNLTDNVNVNVNVNDNDIITPCSRDNSLCTTTTTSEGELDVYTKYIESSKKSQAWLERMGMNFHLVIPQVVSYMDEFRQDCLCRGVDDRNKTLRDFKQHFNNWLRIRIDKERQNNNGNRQSNGAAATREQRQAEAAQLVAEILARDN